MMNVLLDHHIENCRKNLVEGCIIFSYYLND